MKKLSSTQIGVLRILADGGGIVRFDNGEIYLRDCDLNDYDFRISTFKVLVEGGYIESIRSLALGVDEWSLSKEGENILKLV